MLPPLPRTYVDHAVEPRCIADLCDPNAAGEVGSMVGGLGVRVSLFYECGEENNAVIKDACGRAFGDSACVAPLSWLLETVRGQTWEAACAHTPEGVLDALCDGARNGTSPLPAAVGRGAEFAVRALRRALGIAEHGMPADPNGEGVLVCRCIGVGDKTIRRAICDGATTADAIGAACGAGKGCGSCRPDLLTLLDEQLGEAAPPPDPSLHPAARIALARGGPVLRALGLPLVAARVEGDTVVITTGEPTAEALITAHSAIYVLRRILRDTVSEDILVDHS